jgi:peptide-methionine (S)-S-oxide reductase
MKISRTFLVLWLCALGIVLGAVACGQLMPPVASVQDLAEGQQVAVAQVAAPPADPENLETATFAGGCFWSMQRMMDEVPGVITTTVGYAGGEEKNPTYEQVSAEITGHAESVEVIFDSSRISYAELVVAFWHDIDPVAVDQQFCDRGPSYRSAIFYHDAEQQRVAEASKQALEDSGRFSQSIATEIVAVTTFYPAEEYHQKFYLKNPDHYAAYRVGCGRDARLAQIWGISTQ